MILQNLTKLYDQLMEDEDVKIAPPGFGTININFLVNLGVDGEIKAINYVFDEYQSGKKMVERPQRLILPQEINRPGNVVSHLLWDNKTYVFGLADESRDETYCKSRFDAFRERNLAFLEKIDTPEAIAFKLFLKRYTQEDLAKNEWVQTKQEQLLKATGNITFVFEPGQKLIVKSKEIAQAIISEWETSEVDVNQGQCLITGKYAPVQVIHARIKGVVGAQSSGAAIVSFNERAYESYGKERLQGLNSPISELAAFEYTTALNYLLSPDNPHRRLQIGDTSVVYWAESENPAYGNLFQATIDPQWSFELNSTAENKTEPIYDSEMTAILEKIAKSIRNGLPLDFKALETELDPATKFHVLGLAPNAARISIRFYETAPFSSILSRLVQHHEDISMGQERPWSVWRILKETISPKASKQEAAPLLAGAIMRSILIGLPYPMGLYYAILNRVHADSDDPAKGVFKIGQLKAGIIKACLLRKYRNKKNNQYKEVLTMSLNPQSTNQAYLLGRVFAVLEKTQEDAAKPATLNATIKDRYFTAASANPASTFPTLLRLFQHNASKSPYGKNSERLITEIMELLSIENDPFPKRLNLDEQGIFILGYYHQRNDFFKSRKKEESEPQSNEPEIQENLF